MMKVGDIEVTTKQYRFLLRQLIDDKQKLSGKRVVITCANRKSAYHKTLNAIGTIKNASSGSEIGILLDEFTNPSSVKGLFWYRYDEFELLEEESEEMNMGKLTGFKAVAVVKQGYGTYHFAIYDDGVDYLPGDKIMVSGQDNILTIEEVISPEMAEQRYKGSITAEVIGMVDTSLYETRVAKRKEADELKKSMDKAIKEMQEVDKYEMYAKQNPALKEMLNKYKSLVG